MSASDPHAATAPDAIRPATSVEILDRILARESSHRSATTQHDLDTDVGRQLRQAVERYREAVKTAPGTPASGTGPLPWLEAAPIVDDDVWTDYLAARSALVSDLAARIDGHDLPMHAWSSELYRAAPELAAEVAIWRAASGCTSDPTPCGPADCEAPTYRRDLAARVGAVVDVESLPGRAVARLRRDARSSALRRRAVALAGSRDRRRSPRRLRRGEPLAQARP